MGNKLGGRRKTESNGGSGKTKSEDMVDGGGGAAGSNSSSNREKKITSCPDLSPGAVPYKYHASSEDGPREIDIKIHRSYTNVAEVSRRSEPRPDIRVYRRSAVGVPNGTRANGRRGDPADRSQTLPRGFGRYRSSTNPPEDSATLPRSRSTVGQGDLKRQSSLGFSASGGLIEQRAARRSGSMGSMTSIGYKVNIDDFPETSVIKRRLAQFETVFCRSLSQLYSSLPESIQLSALSIAVRPDRANQHISLWQYLNMPDIPINLIATDDDEGPQYALTIQPALFSGVVHIRRDLAGDVAAATSLAGELVACLAAEAAGELARVFEYQVALLTDGLAIELLASHTAHCVIDYMKRSGRHLDRNTIVFGAIRGHHSTTTNITPKLSVIVGQRELKWELNEIFKQPGLRKELFLFTGDIQVTEDNPPWQFYTSYSHDPMLYGYRGLIVEWDYTTTGNAPAGFRLSGEDEASFPDEVDWRPDDFHRTYCPYRRLVGSGLVEEFDQATGHSSSVDRRNNKTLAEYVKRVQGDAFARDQIQVIYRPIGGSTIANCPESNDDPFICQPPAVNGFDQRRQLPVSVEPMQSDMSHFPSKMSSEVVTATRTSRTPVNGDVSHDLDLDLDKNTVQTMKEEQRMCNSVVENSSETDVVQEANDLKKKKVPTATLR